MRTLALLLFVGATAFAQSAAKNCSVDGSVVNSLGGAPVPHAHVSVVAAEDTFFADSDAAGKWSVEHLPCGPVTIAASHVGFLRAQKGQSLAGSRTLIANTPLHDVALRLTPQAVLAGRVLDDQGDPIPGAQVSLLTSRVIGGVRGIQASTSAVTNDLGEYRFSGLVAGKYILCVNAGGGIIVATGARPYGEKCYPGPMDVSPASVMDVAAGYEGRIDFAMSALATFRVSGVVSGLPAGADAVVSLTPRGQIARMSPGLTAKVHADGTFVVRNVPPGSYLAAARPEENLTARTQLNVGSSDVEGLQLHLEPSVAVTGTVKIVSITGKRIDQPLYLTLLGSASAGGDAESAVWDQSKTAFAVPQLLPGGYRLELSPPIPFYVKSVTMGGRDIAGSEFMIAPGAGSIEIVLADDGGTLEGDVTTDDRSVDDGSVAAWVFLERHGIPGGNARADASGHFKIDNLPPAEYKVYAWDDNTNVEYGNPEWMRRNARGVAVTVTSGQTAHVKVTRQTAPAAE